MSQDMLMTYKYGWKTSYYQNTYDFKGEEEELQPAGISATINEDEGEDVILEPENPELVNGVNGHAKISTTADDDGGECEACTI
jgi:ribonucleoside-diphosphate reductase alpha chain